MLWQLKFYNRNKGLFIMGGNMLLLIYVTCQHLNQECGGKNIKMVRINNNTLHVKETLYITAEPPDH
jgi:hypothetical protein